MIWQGTLQTQNAFFVIMGRVLEQLYYNSHFDFIATGVKTDLQDKYAFDSNCITPGSAFMDRVSAAIQCYICDRLASEPAWKNLIVRTCWSVIQYHVHPNISQSNDICLSLFTKSLGHHNTL